MRAWAFAAKLLAGGNADRSGAGVLSSVEFGPNGSVVQKDQAALDGIKQELARKEHAYPDGKTRSVAAFARIARIGLIAWICGLLIQLVMVAGYFFTPGLLPGFFYEWNGNENLNLAVVAGAVTGLIALTTFFFVARFTYRAQKNLFTVGSPHAKMPPGWTVGWYFIPIASLWQPVLGMSQIWRGTYEAVGEKARGSSPIPVWWGCWLAMNVPDWFAQIWPDALVMQFALAAAGTALGIVASLALMRILARVAERQEVFLHGGVATVFD